MKLSWMLVAVLLFNPIIANAEHVLKMRVTSASSSAEMYVYISVERRPENRFLVVSVESEDYFGRSMVQLEGERSARVATFRFRGLPGGDYDVQARLIDNNGRTTDFSRYGLYVVDQRQRY